MAEVPSVFSGLDGAQAAPVLARHLRGSSYKKAIFVTAGSGGAENFAKDLRFFLPGFSVLNLPEGDPPFLRAEAKSRESDKAMAAAADALAAEGPCAVVCPVSAALRALPAPERFGQAAVLAEAGAALDPEVLIRRVAAAGYRREPYAEAPGEFSVRGGLVDVFPIQAEEPYRIEFFGDTVEYIRSYDPETQQTRAAVLSVRIAPVLTVLEAGADSAAGTLADWLGDAGVLIVLDPERIFRALSLRETEARADFLALLEDGDVRPEAWDAFLLASDFEALTTRHSALRVLPDPAPGTRVFDMRTPAPLHGQMDLLLAEWKGWLRKSYAVTVVCSAPERTERLREFAEANGLRGKIEFADGELTAGVEWADEKHVWQRDGDIFKSERKRRRKRLSSSDPMAAFSDIEVGDFVVHERHGIGIFRGMKTMDEYGGEKDYLVIAYAGSDVLYIPVDQMDLVQRYIGSGEKRPHISRLGTGEWQRTKSRVRREIESYARELLQLAAARQAAAGYAFGPDSLWQRDFEDGFPWEPTEDQKRCFAAVKRAMEEPHPMDLLICGDVGYGKTEVALRAAFKCAMEGKQACVLAPTTILAAQHFHTFTERFSDFGVRIEMLSRFQTPHKRAEIHEGIADGSIGIVIGTHALLSNKISFRDLGLLVVDEEQRFGVKHKERIRALKAGVDVLTLSATPIPRTLHMSLIGLRDMELIEDPPEERQPVRTYVSEERADLLAESIRRELDRGGQAYVVYNRVGGIEGVAERLAELIPDARIAVCHAQMNERLIEQTMLDFYEGNSDVLVSTTIIESGLDIPNVNTIAVLDADRLGLTQLYQLRGRVGRSPAIAFCYLFYRRDKVLTDAAEKRLRTLRAFTELGSGFKIAMKDLEIRGAGNLLGTSQHGHMAQVGYELYCKMLEDAAADLRMREGAAAGVRGGFLPGDTSGEGEPGIEYGREEERPESRIETRLPAIIPGAYIEEETVKLQAYKRIARIGSEEEAAAALSELADRYGEPPVPVRNLVWIALIGRRARALGASEAEVARARTVLSWKEAPPRFAERVFSASDEAGRLGAIVETDLRGVPRVRLITPNRKSEEDALRAVCSLLAAMLLENV